MDSAHLAARWHFKLFKEDALAVVRQRLIEGASLGGCRFLFGAVVSGGKGLRICVGVLRGFGRSSSFGNGYGFRGRVEGFVVLIQAIARIPFNNARIVESSY